MSVGEPLRALVVEVGQRALFQFFGGVGILGQDAIGIAGDDFGLDLDEVRRIEPGAAQLVEPLRRFRNADRAGVSSIIGGGDVGRQAIGKGKVSKVVVGV